MELEAQTGEPPPIDRVWKNVPLTFEGKIVGMATVSPNGGILATFNETPEGVELYEKIAGDTTRHLSIGSIGFE